jgi:hypothetical protein
MRSEQATDARPRHETFAVLRTGDGAQQQRGQPWPSAEGTVRLVDMGAFRAVGSPLELIAANTSVAFLPDGGRVIIGQERSTTSALLWDVDPDI